MKFSIENIALGRMASQSTNYLDGVASRAVDGNGNTGFSADSCTHTSMTALVWWRVDFGKTAVVHSVKITNRGKAKLLGCKRQIF